MKINIDVNQDERFRVQSTILFLSRFQEVFDSLFANANKNYESILKTAMVKEERA